MNNLLTEMLDRQCPKCSRVFSGENDKLNIDEFGECLNCEKLRFDI